MTFDRRRLDYAIKVLTEKAELLSVLGPATDRPDHAEARIQAIQLAIELLSKPYVPENPFD